MIDVAKAPTSFITLSPLIWRACPELASGEFRCGYKAYKINHLIPIE